MLKLKEKARAAQPKEVSSPKEQLELAAYYHWLERGCPGNDALTDWVQAERKWAGENEIAGEGDD